MTLSRGRRDASQGVLACAWELDQVPFGWRPPSRITERARRTGTPNCGRAVPQTHKPFELVGDRDGRDQRSKTGTISRIAVPQIPVSDDRLGRSPVTFPDSRKCASAVREGQGL